eukprot:1340859-Amorphochlora_amoeboformis.AAC.1
MPRSRGVRVMPFDGCARNCRSSDRYVRICHAQSVEGKRRHRRRNLERKKTEAAGRKRDEGHIQSKERERGRERERERERRVRRFKTRKGREVKGKARQRESKRETTEEKNIRTRLELIIGL